MKIVLIVYGLIEYFLFKKKNYFLFDMNDYNQK